VNEKIKHEKAKPQLIHIGVYSY